MKRRKRTMMTAQTINEFGDKAITAYDAAVIYVKNALDGNPIHFECNDGKWICVEGDDDYED